MRRYFIYLLFLISIFADSFDSLKDPEVLYFDGSLSELPQDKINALTPLFTDKDLKSLLRHLPAETEVRVLGWHLQGWLIHVNDGRNPSEGWVGASVIQNVTSEKRDHYRQIQIRKKEIQSAIADKKIIPGMLLEEVRLALGKPNQTSFRVDEKGRREVWGYVRYENVPQSRLVKDAYGNWAQVTTLIKVPKGEIKVEFQEGKVVAYEEKK